MHFSRLLPLLLCCLPLLASAEIYKQVDDKGNVTYTDTPSDHKKTEQLELPTINSQPAVRPLQKPSKVQREQKSPSYSVSINAPAEGTQVPMGQHEIPVNLSIEPGLETGYSVQILLNNEPFGGEYFSNNLVLRDVYRGEHQLQAVILDAEGNEVARSDSVTIYVQRRSISRPGAGSGN